jgi:hypothetical protein
LHHAKPPPSVVFSKPMPDIEKLMQVNAFFFPYSRNEVGKSEKQNYYLPFASNEFHKQKLYI